MNSLRASRWWREKGGSEFGWHTGSDRSHEPLVDRGHGPIDPWHLVEPRAAWLTIILIAGLGFLNYVLLKLYGARAVELTGFLGGLVNSTATVAELAVRDRDTSGALSDVTYRGVVLATGAMALRNAALLAVLAPATMLRALSALGTMVVGSVGLAYGWRFGKEGRTAPAGGSLRITLPSPFSLIRVLAYGAMFLTFQVLGALAERFLGHAGFYLVSLLGGLVSSATAVESAGALAGHGTLSATVAANGAVVASLASAAVNLPVVARLAHDRRLAFRLALGISAILTGGLVGWAVVVLWPR